MPQEQVTGTGRTSADLRRTDRPGKWPPGLRAALGRVGALAGLAFLEKWIFL